MEDIHGLQNKIARHGYDGSGNGYCCSGSI
jgi:hypothetical protein